MIELDLHFKKSINMYCGGAGMTTGKGSASEVFFLSYDKGRMAQQGQGPKLLLMSHLPSLTHALHLVV